MKVAIIGSRTLTVKDLSLYIPDDTAEIVSGGAKGIDSDAKAFATACGIPLVEIRPAYTRYKRGAPLKRNEDIVRYADTVLIFWDGVSKGTAHVISLCKQWGKSYTLYIYNGNTGAFEKQPSHTIPKISVLTNA